MNKDEEAKIRADERAKERLEHMQDRQKGYEEGLKDGSRIERQKTAKEIIELISEKQGAIIKNFYIKYPDKASWTPEAQHYQRVIDLCSEFEQALKKKYGVE